MVGLVDDVLADRAFIEDRDKNAAELCPLADLASPAPHFVANALAAAALARAHGVSTLAVREGLRSFRPTGTGSPRSPWSTRSPGSTTPRPPTRTPRTSSLQAYDPVVWVAGGLAKGASFDELVTAVRDRLRGVVLLGPGPRCDRGRAVRDTHPMCA